SAGGCPRTPGAGATPARSGGAARWRWRAAPGGPGFPCRGATRPAGPDSRRSCPPPLALQRPSPHRFEEAVVGEVHMQRRDGNVPVVDRLVVRLRVAGPGDLPAADPEDLPAPRVLHAGEAL